MGFNKEDEEEAVRRQSLFQTDVAVQNESLYAGASFKFDQDDEMCF